MKQCNQELCISSNCIMLIKFSFCQKFISNSFFLKAVSYLIRAVNIYLRLSLIISYLASVHISLKEILDVFLYMIHSTNIKKYSQLLIIE